MAVLQAHSVTARATVHGAMIIEFRIRGEIVAEAHMIDPDAVIQDFTRVAEEARRNGRLDAAVDEETDSQH